MIPWFERRPDWLKSELDSLDTAGIPFTVDMELQRKGILRLFVKPRIGDEQLDLTVLYPDSYPYFRFEVYAPGLSLPHHQNPFQKNLCLLGRRTHFWNTTDTVGGILTEQLTKVLTAGRATTLNDARGLEQEQAEPISGYLPYPPSAILFDSDWSIGDSDRFGTFYFRPFGDSAGIDNGHLRAVVTRVCDSVGRDIATAPTFCRQYSKCAELQGKWLRLKTIKPKQNFLEQAYKECPNAGNAPMMEFEGFNLRMWGLLIEEETKPRTIGQGWMFLYACQRIVGTKRK